jgi:hypothetical protein
MSPDIAARLSGLIDAMRLDARMDRVRAELVLCFALAGGAYTSRERQPTPAEWRREWNAIAATVAQGMADAERDATGTAYRMARARLRRWDHHTSVVDLAWEAAPSLACTCADIRGGEARGRDGHTLACVFTREA